MSNCTIDRKSYFDYLNLPLTRFRKIVFSEIIDKIRFGDVADLGCGDAGIYWSLGYVQRARSITLFDNSEESVNNLLASLESLNPEYLNRAHKNTLEFLRNEKLLTLASKDIVKEILKKTGRIEILDFLDVKETAKFDFVLTIESLEVVNSKDDFLKAVLGAKGLLRENGELLGIIIRFREINDEIKNLAEAGLHGTLSPDKDAVIDTFMKAGLDILDIKTINFPEMNNYHEGVLFHAKKN